MNTTIGWPSSMSAAEVGLVGGRQPGVDGHAEQVGVDERRPARRGPRRPAARRTRAAHRRRTRPAARRLRGSYVGHLDGVGHGPPARRRTRRWRGGSGRRPRPAGASGGRSTGTWKYSSAATSRPAPLQLVEQAEARGCRCRRRRSSAPGSGRRRRWPRRRRRRPRRTSGRPARRRPSLRRSSGWSASANDDGRGDRDDDGHGAAPPRRRRSAAALDRRGRRRCHQRHAPSRATAPAEQRRDAPRPQRQVEPRAPEDAGHRDRAEQQRHADDDVQRAQRRRADRATATTAATAHTTSTTRAAPGRGGVDEPAGADELADRARTRRRGGAGRCAMPSPTPMAASGGEPKWSSELADVAGPVRELVGHRRQPQHDADADGPRTRCARRPRRSGGRRAPTSGRRRRRGRARPCPTPSGRYGTWVWAQNVAAATSGTSIRWSPHSTAHAASRTTIHATSGQVRVPRLGQR